MLTGFRKNSRLAVSNSRLAGFENSPIGGFEKFRFINYSAPAFFFGDLARGPSMDTILPALA